MAAVSACCMWFSPDKTKVSSLFPDHYPDRDRDSDDPITLVPSLRRRNSGCGSRNDIRGGTIELSHAPAVKRTPPTSPFSSPALPTVPLSTPTPPAHSQAPPYFHSNSFSPHSHRSINSSPKTGSPAQVKRIHHPSRTVFHPLPVGAQV